MRRGPARGRRAAGREAASRNHHSGFRGVSSKVIRLNDTVIDPTLVFSAGSGLASPRRCNQADAGDVQSVRRLVDGDLLAGTRMQHTRHLVRQPRQPLRERPGQLGGSLPPLARTRRRGSGVASSPTTTSTRPASASTAASRSGRRARTARGRPGGGTGTPICSPTASKMMPSHGLRSRGPQTRERDAPARAQHAADLARGARRVGHEHQPLAAEHDVERARPARRSARGRARACSRWSARRAARAAAIAVISGATSDTTTSPPAPTRCGRGQPDAAGPQASSSTRSPGRGPVSSSIRSVTAAPRASTKSACSSQPPATDVPHARARWARGARPPRCVSRCVHDPPPIFDYIV